MRKVSDNQIFCACKCGQLRPATDPQGRPAKYLKGHHKRITIPRICYACGTKNINQWMLNKGTNFVLCKHCAEQIIYRERWLDYQKKRLLFRGKRIHLLKQIRTGKCSKCGKTGRTDIHHEKYDPNDPIANTAELCVSCHTLRSAELGQIDLDDRIRRMRKANPRIQEVPRK